MGTVPFMEEVVILNALLTVGVTIVVFYKYLKTEKRQFDLVLGIGFLMVSLAFIMDYLDLKLGFILYDYNLGNLEMYLFLLAYIVFVIAFIIKKE